MLRLRFAALSMTGNQGAGTCHAERNEASHTTSTVLYVEQIL